MNNFQVCRNTTDAIPLYLPQRLYLKPSARFNISLQLPNMRKLEKSVSHWEIMEQLRTMIRPDEFCVLKVAKTTPEFIRFDAELDNRTRLDRVLTKLDKQTIKLKEITQLIRLKASETRIDYPTRQKWDHFFQESKDMDEMKPGQRPDTIHLSNLPRKWFVPYHINDNDNDDDDDGNGHGDGNDVLPSEKIFFRIFEKFGPIRYVDIPICDPYRKKMKDQISGIRNHTIDDKCYFEGYVQFKDYASFTKTIDTFKGMKLMRKQDDPDQVYSVNIKVDFDRLKHLSDASIRRREIVRERLVRRQKDKEDKEQKELEDKREKEQSDKQKEIDQKAEKERRRKEREEKRKRKIMEKLKINECDEINDKIAKEEKKLLKAQRKLEAIRLVEELFRRIKEKKDELNLTNQTKGTSVDELKQFKEMSEIKVIKQRQKLQSAIEGRVVLKSILSGGRRRSKSSSSSDSSASTDKLRKKHNIDDILPPDLIYNPNWYNYHPYPAYYPPPIRGVYHNGPRLNYPGPSRGNFPGRNFGRNRNYGRRYRYNRNNRYPPDVEKEYIKYFSKFVPEHDDRGSRSRSRSRYTPPRSKRRSSYSRSRSYSRSSSSSRRSRSSSRSTKSSRRRRRSRSKTRSKSPAPKK